MDRSRRRRQLIGLAAATRKLDRTLALWSGAADGRVPACSWLRDAFDSDDLTIVPVTTGRGALWVAYLGSQVEPKQLAALVLQPLGQSTKAEPRLDLPGGAWAPDRSTVLTGLLRGKAAVLGTGRVPDAVLVDVAASRSRSLSAPMTEVSVQGPKVGFTEDLTVNVSLVRGILATPSLRLRELTVGTLSNTRIAVVWLDGVASGQVVDDVARRLENVRTDVIVSSQDLIQIAFHQSWTPFSTVQVTERPDRVGQALSLGRVAVIVSGTPFVMLLPTTIAAVTKHQEALNGPPLTVMFIRWLRYLGMGLALVAPAVYVALLSVDPTLLPADTLIAVAQSRVGIPFQVLLEALGQLLVLDIVIEASLHAPSPVGQTVTVVGGLIIGQAAVQAHVVSQLVVIVAAVVGIGTLLIPDISLAYAIRIAKYPLMIAAGVLGFLGLTMGLILVVTHIVSLESASVPYATPFGPVRPWSLQAYTLLSKARGRLSLRPGTYRPSRLRRSPPGGVEH
jgi:hypothetical protein